MSNETWLAPDDVKELTGLVRWSAQSRKLAEMGIPFRPNGLGRPLVERIVAAPYSMQPKPKPQRKPNWSAIRGKTP